MKLDEGKKFKLIYEEDKIGLTNESSGEYILDNKYKYQNLISYINQLLETIEHLKETSVFSNTYVLQPMGEDMGILTDYQQTIELLVDTNEVNQEVVDLINMLEDKSATYYTLISLLIRKLGFNSMEEFLEQVDEEYFDD